MAKDDDAQPVATVERIGGSRELDRTALARGAAGRRQRLAGPAAGYERAAQDGQQADHDKAAKPDHTHLSKASSGCRSSAKPETPSDATDNDVIRPKP